MNPPVMLRGHRRALSALLSVLVFLNVAAFAETLRIVTYNVLADSGTTTVGPGFYTVMQGIGDEIVNGVSEPIDILALQETTSNATTVAPIVTQLNTMYGAGTYAMSTYQATQNGSAGSGNGPNAMVYKTTTLQLVASVGIGTPSTSGFPRQPVRYQFRPVGGDASFDFYVYVSHAKSGTTSTDKNRRNIEAQAIRTNEATLPAAARVFYVGDWNLTASTETAYQTLLATGNGQGFDPPNMPGNWELNPAIVAVMSYSGSNLRYRDDFILVTQNIMNDPSGIFYIAGSFRPFGNNGSVGVNGSLNSVGNTALPGLPNRAAVLAAINTASDHIPVVADFEIDLGGGGQAPAITAQPSNDTACTGGLASFGIAASGSPAPTFQWRLGTTNLVNGGNISGATTDTLTINPVGSGDAATNYNCVATNASGSATSNNASLTVNVGPALTAQPGNQTVCASGAASFSVTATGSPAPAYQWRKGTTNLSNGGNISGATTATLTINPVAAGDAATTYNCVVTNTCSSATSNNASLTVNTGPALTAQPGNQAACSGSAASFSVTAMGSPAPTYQWRKGTTSLTNAGNISGATTATLTINPVAAGDAASNYNCVVTNTCSSATSDNATLTVNVGPALTAQPSDQTACSSGGSASFSVTATGTPAPTYQWRKGTTNLTNGGNIAGATTATLTLDPVGSGDAAANYNCVVTNSCGATTSSNAALAVNSAPVIATQPEGQTLTSGGTAVFAAAASGSPAPAYQWRKDTVPLTDGGSISGSATATLTISPVAASDAGNYDVVLTNPCGSATSARAPFWRLGDMNCDGTVNFRDINPFVQTLTDPSGYGSAYPSCNLMNGDVNGDGSVNFRDINPFVTVLTGG